MLPLIAGVGEGALALGRLAGPAIMNAARSGWSSLMGGGATRAAMNGAKLATNKASKIYDQAKGAAGLVRGAGMRAAPELAREGALAAGRTGMQFAKKHPYMTGFAGVGALGMMMPSNTGDPALSPAQAMAPQTPEAATATPNVSAQQLLQPGGVDALRQRMAQNAQTMAAQIINNSGLAANASGAYARAMDTTNAGQEMAQNRLAEIYSRIDAANAHGQLYGMAPGTIQALNNAMIQPGVAAMQAAPHMMNAVTNRAQMPSQIQARLMNANANVYNAATAGEANISRGALYSAQAHAVPYAAASDAISANAGMINALGNYAMTMPDGNIPPQIVAPYMAFPTGVLQQFGAYPQQQVMPQ